MNESIKSNGDEEAKENEEPKEEGEEGV